MNFSSEKLLTASFLTQPKSFFRKVTGRQLNRYYVLKEFNSGYGIADIVLGAFTPHLSTRSIRSTIDSNWAGVLADDLAEDPFSALDFANKYKVSLQTVRKKLNQLVDAGFLKFERSKYSKFKEYKMAVDTSIAIEAKLKNWKQALSQARRYKRFANYSYVLLDDQFSVSAQKNIHVFERYNIGLISMNKNKVSIHHSPKQKQVPENAYLYKLNEDVNNYFRETYGSS